MSKIESGPIQINQLVESRDLDGCLGYLSLVNGLHGAILYSREGLVMAWGQDTHESLFIEAPYFVSSFIENLERCRMLGLGPLEQAVSFTETRFHLILNLERSDRYLMAVSGNRGSYELYKFRIERGAHAVSQLLHARGYLRG